MVTKCVVTVGKQIGTNNEELFTEAGNWDNSIINAKQNEI